MRIRVKDVLDLLARGAAKTDMRESSPYLQCAARDFIGFAEAHRELRAGFVMTFGGGLVPCWSRQGWRVVASRSCPEPSDRTSCFRA